MAILLGIPSIVGAQVVPDAVGIAGPTVLTHERDQVSWRNGERYDFLTGRMSHYVVDMNIAGNGSLPIVIARTHGASGGLGGIDLAIPNIRFSSNGGGDHFAVCKANNCLSNQFIFKRGQQACQGLQLARGNRWEELVDGNDEEYVVIKSGVRYLRSGISFNDGKRQIQFFPVNGFSGDVSRFPADADYVSPDNWYIRCNGTTFNAYSPDGTTYELSNWNSFEQNPTFGDSRRESKAYHSIYVSRIIDPHGNTLNYTFSDKPSVSSNVKIYIGLRNRLLIGKIVRSLLLMRTIH